MIEYKIKFPDDMVKESIEGYELIYTKPRDVECRLYKRKAVKTRKPHGCNYCGSSISTGEIAQVETGFHEAQNYKYLALYVCRKCIESAMLEQGAEQPR